MRSPGARKYGAVPSASATTRARCARPPERRPRATSGGRSRRWPEGRPGDAVERGRRGAARRGARASAAQSRGWRSSSWSTPRTVARAARSGRRGPRRRPGRPATRRRRWARACEAALHEGGLGGDPADAPVGRGRSGSMSTALRTLRRSGPRHRGRGAHAGCTGARSASTGSTSTSQPGECFGFLGPNGAGQDDLHPARARPDPPDLRASVAVMGHDVAADRMGALAAGRLPAGRARAVPVAHRAAHARRPRPPPPAPAGAARRPLRGARARRAPSCASGCATTRGA